MAGVVGNSSLSEVYDRAETEPWKSAGVSIPSLLPSYHCVPLTTCLISLSLVISKVFAFHFTTRFSSAFYTVQPSYLYFPA
jgi:hypothetical protein